MTDTDAGRDRPAQDVFQRGEGSGRHAGPRSRASYVGFGSLVRESGIGLGLGLFSTLSAWALPGQVVLVELYGVGASLLVICLAVALTNARLMPMVITLMPLVHDPAVPRWRYYLYSHLVAVTAWAFSMRRCPDMARPLRLPYFVGFAVSLWIASLIGTAAGFLLADSVPRSITLGLVFLNPDLLHADLRDRPAPPRPRDGPGVRRRARTVAPHAVP